MTRFISRYGRFVLSILALIFSTFFADFDFTSIETFAASVIENGSFMIGTASALLIQYVGKVKLTLFDPDAPLLSRYGRTVSTIAVSVLSAVVAAIHPEIASGGEVDPDALVALVDALMETGWVSLGAVFGTATHYFGQVVVRLFEPDPAPST